MTKDKNSPEDTQTLPLDLGEPRGLAVAREPTAREVNRQISAELKAQKLKDRAAARSTGAGVAVLQRVQKKYPNNPKKQVAAFMEEFVIRAGTGRPRPVAARTSTGYSNELTWMLDDLREDRAGVQNLGELGKSHALRLIKLWVKRGQSASTVQNRISILRRFFTFVGKPSTIPMRDELASWLNANGVEVPSGRSQVATTSKAWDQHGVDFHEVVRSLESIDALTSMQLEVQAAFGLRMKESLQLDPRAADYGDVLRVVHGTKGGLPRDVPFDDDQAMREWQRDVLERAKLLAGKNRKGILCDPQRTLEQNKRHFYYQVEKVGITRADLGVTAHGLRHQYAARRYEQIAGMPPPVARNSPRNATPEQVAADHEARVAVSRALGHFRDDISKAYVGSIPMRERGARRRIKDWIERTEENPEFQQAMARAGISKVWLGGSFGKGLEPFPHEALRLHVTHSSGAPMTREIATTLRAELAPIYARGVDISDHLIGGQDDDWLELHLQSTESSPTVRQLAQA